MTSGPFADAAAVRAFVEGDAGLRRVFDESVRRSDGDPAHDVAHALRVALWTTRLAPADVPARSAVAAALLHDVVNLPKNSPRRSEASALSADVARALLPSAGFEPEETRVIAEAIRTHSFSRGETPLSPLGDALQDADRLEALGALGVFRCVATAAKLGGAFFDPTDPWATERPLDDRAFALDHFFVKLFALPATMRTAAGRREAERRAAFLGVVVRALGEELATPPPAPPPYG